MKSFLNKTRCSNADKLSKQKSAGDREVSVKVETCERKPNNALFNKDDLFSKGVRVGTPEAIKNLKENHPQLYSGYLSDELEKVVHTFFGKTTNTEAMEDFFKILKILKEMSDSFPDKKETCIILADTYHQQFAQLNTSSDVKFDYNFFPETFSLEDVYYNVRNKDVEEEDETIPLYSFDPSYIRKQFCKFEAYQTLFGKDSSYFEECIHAHIHLAVRLSECRSVSSFFFHICDYFKDIVGITYGEFIREYEKFIVIFMGTCFGVNVIYNMIPERKRKSERSNMPIVQSGDKVSKYNFRRFLDQMKMFIRNKKRVMDSDFVNQFGNFCSLILCTPFFVKMGVDHTLFGYSTYYTRKMQYKYKEKHILGVSFEILEGAVYIMDKITLYVETGDLTAFFIDDEEIAKYETKYLQLTEFKDLPGAMANFGWSVDDYYRECDKCIEQGKKLQHFYAHDKVKLSALKVQQSMLARYKMKAYVKMQVESKREPPIGFCLYGPPSVGKSALIDKLCHCLYENSRHIRKEGRKYTPSMKYMYNEDDEYFSEFKISKEVCVIDDVDQFKDDINLMKKGGGMAKAIYLINPIPYITNQAAIEDKGMIPFMCKYVIATTNTYDAGISKIFRKHGGAYRRFFFIEVAVKPEFQAPDSTQLRGDLSDDGFKNHELHYFKFRKYVSRGNESSAFYWNKNTKTFVQTSDVPEMSFKELSILLYKEVQVPHYRQNDATEKSVDDFLNKDFCEKCCSVFCDCVEVQSGMDAAVTPLVVNNWHFFGGCVMFFAVFYIFFILLGYFISTYYRSRHYQKLFLSRIIGSYRFCWCRAVPNPMRNYIVRDYITLWLERQVRTVYNCGLVQKLNDWSVSSRRHKYKIVALASLASLAGIVYKTYRTAEPEVQSSVAVEPKQEVKAKNNSWKVSYQDLVKVSGPPSTTTIDQLSKRLEHNVVYLKCDTPDGVFYTNGFGYKGNLLYVPKHWVNKISSYGWPRKIDVIRESVDNSVGRNRLGIYITGNNIMDPQFGDMMIIRHASFGTFRDVSKFIIDDFLPGLMKGHILIRDGDGTIYRNSLHGVGISQVNYKCDGENYKYVGYCGHVETPTNYGDCGAPYLVETINGVFIAGFHVAAIVDKEPFKTKVFCCPLGNINLDNHFIPASYNGLNLQETYISKENLQVEQKQHPKCPIRDVNRPEVAIYGSISTPRRKMKSAVCETLMCNDVLEHYGLVEPLHTSPKGISSRQAAINNFVPMFEKQDIPQHYVSRAIDSIFEWYRREMFALGGIPDGPLDLDSAINGVDGVPYMERMPVKTSGGFGHKGAKLKHFVELPPTDEHSTRYGFDDALMKEYNTMLARYKDNERGQVIWDFNFKDEPVTHSKVQKQKCRIFNSGPCAFIALERQYFLWCVPFFSGKYRHLFGSAIGANVFGTDWEVIYKHVTKHGIERMIAGDYEHFDKGMHAQMSLGAFEVLLRLMRDAGWSQEDINVAMGIATDICYPMSNAFGTIIEVDGTNPSGHSLTTILNCIVNIMYIQIAVMHIEEERNIEVIDYANFLDYVSAVTFGDDNVMSSKYDWINHVAIADVLARYGVVFTMADKVSEIIPFTHIDDIDFLKRKFVPDVHGIGTVAAPLAEESIIKMLTVVCKSNSIHFEQQCAEVIAAANREYFQYGKKICNEKKQFLDNLVDKHNLRPYLNECTLLDYDAIHNSIYGYGPSDEDADPLKRITATAQSGFSWIHPEETEMSLNLVEYSLAARPHVISTDMINIKPKTGKFPSSVLSSCCIKKNTYKNENHDCNKCYRVEEGKENLDPKKIVIQSGTTEDIKVSDTSEEIEQNVEFTDAVQQYDLMIGERVLDETYSMAKVGDADDLAKFLERPVRIFNKFWDVVEAPAYVNAINPWQLFLNNDKVKNKMETFKLLNGTLHIKMLVNGSPFHYGRMFVGCRPSVFDNNQTPLGPTVPDTIFPYVDNAGSSRVLFGSRTLYSSRPHVFLDPSTNQPQHISWPFFSPGNYIDLNEPITVERMGVLEIWELNQLKHANGATDGVEITFFAWMSDTKLAGLTAKPVAVQSGVKTSKKGKTTFTNSGDDEHKPNGLISAPASTLASYAKHFVNIPYIGPFAKATNIGASAISGIAKIFGYSRPAVLTDTAFYKTQPYGNMANYSGADPLQKLSLDPKQELTIDPGTVGLDGEDQMSFAYLAKKEAWIDTIPWNLPNDPLQSQGKIYSIVVHPMVAPVFNIQPDGGGLRGYAQTPLSFVTRPFEFWTGSLRYRFQIVCSQFHRGRLMFVYEPDLLAGTDEDDVNNRFTHIVDIAEERDVTFEVNWTQENAYRRTDMYALLGSSTIYTRLGSNLTGTFAFDDRAKSNGKLEVYVLNQLAAPIDASDVEINVYISAGDSFEVKAPGRISQWTYMNNTMDPVGPPALAQSGFLSTVTDNENSPEQDVMYVLNGNLKLLDLQQSNVYFGETVVSLRSLLKRYCFHRALYVSTADTAPTTNTIYLTEYVVNTMPVGPGKLYGSSTTSNISATSTSFYNICGFTYLRYALSAFIGYRGSIRWKVGYYGTTQNEVSLRAARTTEQKVESVAQDLVIDNASSRSTVAQLFLEASTYEYNQCGTVATVGNVMPTLEFEIPFYHNYRFAECNTPPVNSYNPLRDPTHTISVTHTQNSNDEYGWLETQCATGEDFSLFFFIGAPILLTSDVSTITPSLSF